ncbi:MAG: glycosyltransferase family 4 protein [Acidimicrobiaceae bacterium]|nr:glycosyltransferase family 4 protein [Acidimicrobiaceae bacterium]
MRTRASWVRSRSLEVPEPVAARPARSGGLSIAFLVYRGNPTVGGQGIYTRYLTRELVRMGHRVEVFAGPPWPVLDEGVGFTPIPGLDLYRQPDPFRTPAPFEIRHWPDLIEALGVRLGSFPEPRTFAMRVRRSLRGRREEFDLIHDDQCIAPGIAALRREGWPILETLHHPITVDRRIALEHATSRLQRYGIRRWYGFVKTQIRVLRALGPVVTVSESSRRDIEREMGVPRERVHVVPVGVDHEIFRPRPEVARRPGRLMVTSSSDAPMKGLVPLLHAVATVRATRPIELVLIGRPEPGGRVDQVIEELGLRDVVTTIAGVSDEEMAVHYAQSEIAVVPSLYEGFSLPAIEAMACATPLVATTGGAIPEVVGEHGVTALLVEPNDSAALVGAITTMLDDPDLRRRLGEGGRQRVLDRYTWEVTARETVHLYRALLGESEWETSEC